MPSFPVATLATAAVLAGTALAAAAPMALSSSIACPLSLPLSCSNTTTVEDLCCFEYPGGTVLQTQFWDYDPATGPSDKWTVHGLWPDNCDGTYEQYCDKSMEVSNVSAIIQAHDSALLAEMQTYWKDYQGDDESLWEHEFNKHGTCYSTLKPTCGNLGENNENVYQYFRIAMNLYSKLPTYDWLAEAGIVPTNDKTYTKDEIISALKSKSGAEPYIGCNSDNAIDEVWYFYHLQGSLLGEDFVAIDTLTTSKSCSSTGIKYVPKSSNTVTPVTGATTTTGTSTTTAEASPSSTGYVKLTGQNGCLIKNGKWYVSGTCATYTLTQLSTGSYTLKSKAGWCTIDSKTLHCGSDVSSPFEFEFDIDSQILVANGGTQFSAANVPTGTEQVEVTQGEGAVNFELQWNSWDC